MGLFLPHEGRNVRVDNQRVQVQNQRIQHEERKEPNKEPSFTEVHSCKL